MGRTDARVAADIPGGACAASLWHWAVPGVPGYAAGGLAEPSAASGSDVGMLLPSS